MYRYLFCVLVGVACSGNADDTDSGDTEPVDTEEEYKGCTETVIEVDGPESPVVGDSWTVWMHCDGVLMTGGMVIIFDPLDFATKDSNVITFSLAGEGEMMVQMGSYRETMDITVSP